MNGQCIQESHRDTSSSAGRILIADDQQHILFALEMLLSSSGFSTETATHPSRVLSALEKQSFDAILIDLNYTRDTVGGAEGLDLLSKIRSIDSVVPVVVMTAWSTVDLAVEAMRRGASDFIQKPWENHELLQKLQEQLSLAREQRRKLGVQEEELRDAREIQASLLPKTLPEVAGYEIAAINQPLRHVGGDYYNVLQIDDRHTAVCIADVAGKGMPAALLMSTLQAALRPLIAQKLAPGELCHRLNRILCELMPSGKFISFFYGVLDSVENRLTYCNAGHNPPLLIRADGGSSELGAEGAVLGQFPDWQYRQSELALKSGDRLLLFTDGLVENSDNDDEPFGEQSLLRIVRENPRSSAHALMTSLMHAALEHCNDRFQDDASLIVMKASAQDGVVA